MIYIYMKSYILEKKISSADFAYRMLNLTNRSD